MSPQPAKSATAVAASMRAAYDQLIRELSEAAEAVRVGHGDGIARLARFRTRTSAQLDSEEQGLFPLLDGGGGADRAVLERDHLQIRDALDRADAQLACQASSDFSDVVQELMLMLRAHCIRETRLLFAYAPALLDSAGPAQVERLRHLFPH